MKKILLGLLSLVIGASVVFGDASPNPFLTPGGVTGDYQKNNKGSFAAGVLHEDSNGNVGVGTKSPSYNLDVAGAVRVQGLGDSFFSGNVGIGTVTTSHALDIAGTVNAISFIGDGSALTGINSGGWTRTGTNLSPSVLTDTVGIGTITPTAINAHYFAGMYNSINNASIFFNDNPNSGTTSQVRFELKTADSNGAVITFPSNFTTGAWAGRTMLYNLSGNGVSLNDGGGDTSFFNVVTERARLTGAGRLGIGTSTPASFLTIKGNMGIGTTAGDAYLTTAAPNGGAIIYGNVGVGSLSPGQKLDVIGTTRSTAFLGDGSALTGLTKSQVGLSNVENTALSTWAGSSNITTVGNLTANVGIGTPNPSQALDVAGTVNAFSFIGDGSGLTGISAGGWTRTGSNVSPTTLTDTVGMGTTTPTAINANYTHGVYRNVNNTATLFVYNPNSGTNAQARFELKTLNTGGELILLNQNFGTASWAGKLLLWDENATGLALSGHTIDFQNSTLNRIRMDANGNLGINTLTPGSSLTILKNSTNDYFHLNSTGGAGGNVLAVKNSGNVGIGSSNPGQLLDIAGTARMTAFALSTNPSSGYVLTSNSVGVGTWMPAPSGSGTGTVTSVTLATPSSTLTLGGTNPVTTSGTINADIDLTHANTWTGQQIFNTANVGISSLNPGAKLDIAGTARMTAFVLSTTPSSGYVLTSNSVGVGTWMPVSSSGSGTVTSVTLASPNSTLSLGGTNPVTSTGTINADINLGQNNTWTGLQNFTTVNVGIASSAPGQSLDVVGTVRATAFIGDGSGITGLGASTWTAVGNDTYKASNGNIGIGTTIITNAALTVMNGNVGIGTWKPINALEVKGGNVGIGTFITSHGLEIAGTAQLTSTNGTGSQFTIVDNSVTTGNLLLLSSSVNSATATGSMLNISAGGSNALVNALNITDTNTNGNLAIFQDANNDTSPTVIQHGGNIGIGTVSANSQKLAIVGNVGIGTIKDGDNYLINSPPAGGLITEGNIAIGTWVSTNKLDVSGGIAVGSYAGVNPANSGDLLLSGNLGIGTNSLSTNGKLTVMGNVGIQTVPSTNAALVVSGTTQATQLTGTSSVRTPSILDNGVNLSISTGANTRTITIGPNSGSTIFMPNNSNIGVGTILPSSSLAISGNLSVGNTYTNGISAPANGAIILGNVGIGSSAPGKQLDVTGTVRATAFVGDGSLLTGISSGSGVGIGTTGWMPYYNANGSNVVATSNLQIVGSNVGIGSATPGTTLDVQGAIRSSSTISVGNGNATITGDSNGNVGIGSAIPIQTLDIAGTSRMAGFVLTTNPSAGYVLTSSSIGLGTWMPAPSGVGGSGTVNSGTINQLAYYAGSGTSVSSLSAITTDGTGNVGIGTTSPVDKGLTIRMARAGDIVSTSIINTNSTGYSQLTLGNDTGNDNFQIGMAGSTDDGGIGGANRVYIDQLLNAPIIIKTFDKGRIFIAGGGNIGIGTIAPTQGFQIGTDAADSSGFVACIGSGNCIGKCTALNAVTGACSSCACLQK